MIVLCRSCAFHVVKCWMRVKEQVALFPSFGEGSGGSRGVVNAVDVVAWLVRVCTNKLESKAYIFGSRSSDAVEIKPAVAESCPSKNLRRYHPEQ